MKNRILGFISIVFLLVSCGGNSDEKHDDKKISSVKPENIDFSYRGPDYKLISNCLRTTLSYKLQIEPRDYDSIATYYFHEIRDYTNPEIKAKSILLKTLKQNHKDSIELLTKERNAKLEAQIDILQQELNVHFKDVIGYVFVHSFTLKEKDTVSAIFVMDQNCGYKELIKVKVITDPNPEDYVESIRGIQK